MVTELSAPASTALPSVNSNLALNDRSAAWKTWTWQLSADPAAAGSAGSRARKDTICPDSRCTMSTIRRFAPHSGNCVVATPLNGKEWRG